MLSSSQKERSRDRSAASYPLSASPGDGPLRTPWLTSRVSDVVCTPTPGAASRLAEEDLWKRPREVGIDEENLRQKDKAALISYITKLETELYECQHQMGLLLLEKKEWASKHEKVKADAELAEEKYKRERATHLRSLAEAEKWELSLKTSLGVAKECITSLEKALREMQSDLAEIKTTTETKLAEARRLKENAQNLSLTAESRLHAAEALEAEASGHRSVAERTLQEIEAREDALRRKHMSFDSEFEAKEEELRIEKQRLQGLQTVLQVGQERLLEGQTLLSERDKVISEKFEELRQLEKQLEATKETIKKDLLVVEEEKANLSSKLAALATREEAAIQKELLNQKKEQELLIFQENIATKERDELKRLTDEHQLTLQLRRKEFESELDHKRKLMEDELAVLQRSLQQREADVKHREELMHGREQELEMDKQELQRNEKEMEEMLRTLDERERVLKSAEEKIEMEKKSMQEEREELKHTKLELDRLKELLENEKKQILSEQKAVEMKKSERQGFVVLEIKLKEEIDYFRAQKRELIAEADELKSQKLKLESEWELFDEKRGELQREIEQVAEERKAITRLLKEEKGRLKMEKEALQDQFKHDSDVLFNERNEFMSKMARDHSEWFSRNQREREDIAKDFEVQKRELENNIKKRHEEIERFFKERQELFQQEKARDISQINSQRELALKELEEVALERKRLETERQEIVLDREQREREWSAIRNDIEELQVQHDKLKKQRELLHKDREEIQNQIQILRRLEGLHEAAENMLLPGSCSQGLAPNTLKMVVSNEQNATDVGEIREEADANDKSIAKQDPGSASPNSTLSWFRRCAEKLFKLTPEKSVQVRHETDQNTRTIAKPSKLFVLQETGIPDSDMLDMNSPNAKMVCTSKMGAFMGDSFVSEKENNETGQAILETFHSQSMRSSQEELKVIHEVPSARELGSSSHGLSPEFSLKEIDVAHCTKVAVVDVKEKRAELTDDVPNGSLVGRKRPQQALSSRAKKPKRTGRKNKRKRLLNDTAESTKENTSMVNEAGNILLDQPSVVGLAESSGLVQGVPLAEEHNLGTSEDDKLTNLQKFEVMQNNDSILCGQSSKDILVLSSSCKWQEAAESGEVQEKSCLCPAGPSDELTTSTIHRDGKENLLASKSSDTIEATT
ncbi:protein CROWDED NUCLEI 4-like [Nymphaea colorata]|nr:protein CROWDED NUCLEI 4-like [Nymphaea colorata]